MGLKWRTWLFDVDGVLLDSNAVKSAAFWETTLRYGSKAAQAFVDYHIRHGGVSRFKKYRHFFDGILRRPPEPGELEELLADFAIATQKRMQSVEEDPFARRILEAIAADGGTAFVVSGGLESEVRSELERRGLGGYFQTIYGSPRSKAAIVEGIMASDSWQPPGVLIGDSALDHRVATRHGLDFVLVTHWSEWDSGPTSVDANTLVVEDLSCLLEIVGPEGSVLPDA